MLSGTLLVIANFQNKNNKTKSLDSKATFEMKNSPQQMPYLVEAKFLRSPIFLRRPA